MENLQTRQYVARFIRQQHVTQGPVVLVDDETTDEIEFAAPDAESAIQKAGQCALEMAERIAKPVICRTSVTMLELKEKEGQPVDVIAELQKNLPSHRFAVLRRLRFPDGQHYTVESTI